MMPSSRCWVWLDRLATVLVLVGLASNVACAVAFAVLGYYLQAAALAVLPAELVLLLVLMARHARRTLP